MNYSPAKTLILFFLGLIITGVLLLSLPAARGSGSFSFVTNLFTSVSAVCVTGLSVVNVGEYYSIFGQTVILILVQLGGIGYMFVSTFITLLCGKVALKDRRIMQDIFDISSFSGLKKLLSKAVFFVLAIEFTGAVILTFIFLRNFSFLKSAYLGIFYSITAFCNAGFGFFCDSLVRFANDPALLYVISVLVFIGGLGFFVIIDIYDTYREKHLHLWMHTKVVLSVTAAITFFAFILFLFSDTLRGHGIFYSINNAFFQAVSARTAGFYSVPVNLFSEFTDVMLLFLMSAGASPGSTSGGVKVTTLALVFVFAVSVLRGDDDFVLFKRRIPDDLVKKALAVFIIFFASIAFFSAILILLESCLKPLAIVFEVFSAFATVGLSLGITADLSVEGKVLIIIAMIAGRIGMLTLLILLLDPIAKKKSIKYPEARILVG
jgi:trk system potassium uptake protein TrkH